MMHHMLGPEDEDLRAGRARHGREGPHLVCAFNVFNRQFERMRAFYTSLLTGRWTTAGWCWRASSCSWVDRMFLVTFVGQDFFPTVDSGQMRLHARAPTGTRIEKTEMIFARISKTRSAA